jgi:hypothetical protein
MAAYRAAVLAGDGRDWGTFLAAHASGTPLRFAPRPEAVPVLAAMATRYRRLLAAQPALDAAVGRTPAS